LGREKHTLYSRATKITARKNSELTEEESLGEESEGSFAQKGEKKGEETARKSRLAKGREWRASSYLDHKKERHLTSEKKKKAQSGVAVLRRKEQEKGGDSRAASTGGTRKEGE